MNLNEKIQLKAKSSFCENVFFAAMILAFCIWPMGLIFNDYFNIVTIASGICIIFASVFLILARRINDKISKAEIESTMQLINEIHKEKEEVDNFVNESALWIDSIQEKK